jgi:hypothetical protein
VVLHDPGVSRRHARIFTRGGRYYVVDLGSSRGTELNGKPLGRGAEQELRGGDRLALGPLELLFTPLVDPDDEPTQLAAPEPVKPRARTVISRAQTEHEMQAMESGDTGSHRIVPEPPLVAPPPVPLATLTEVKVPHLPKNTDREQRALAAPAATVTEFEIPTITQRVSPQAGRQSAADRARLRREQQATLWGRLLNRWQALSPKARSFAGVMTGLGIVTALSLLFLVDRPGEVLARSPGSEPSELRMAPIADSFGVGEGVTWKQPVLKAFDFEFASPTRAVAVLHYQARDISQSQEVSIHLNGTELG